MLVSLGLDHRRARLEVRERFHLRDPDVRPLLRALAARGASETVLARTCNRVEVYCWWPAPRASAPELGQEICRAWVGAEGAEAEVLRDSALVRVGREAALHLFRVAAGLESQILGDIHILGQLRRAFREAIDADAVGPHLHRLFETAFRVGKQVQRGTRLRSARNSVGAEAARRAAAHWHGVADRACVVVGCGKSGTHAARALVELGATDLTVLNRTVDTAERLARELGGVRAGGLDALPAAVAHADVVIVATGAAQPVLTASMLGRERAHGAPRQPLLVIDVAVPRNVEAAVAALPAVELVDLDSLHAEAAEVERARREAVPQAEALVEDGVTEFGRWLELHSATRLLRPLQDLLSAVCHRELAHIAGEPSLAERTADRIVARIMAQPMAVLRAACERGESLEDEAAALGSLFAGPRPAKGTDSLRDRRRSASSLRRLVRDERSERLHSDAFSHHAELSEAHAGLGTNGWTG